MCFGDSADRSLNETQLLVLGLPRLDRQIYCRAEAKLRAQCAHLPDVIDLMPHDIGDYSQHVLFLMRVRCLL